MGLEFHIENEIRYSTDIKYKNLYGWCLREYSSDGEALGRDWIPWRFSLTFRASHLILSIDHEHRRDEDEGEDEGEGDKKASSEHPLSRTTSLEVQEKITARLDPNEFHGSPPSYYFMGSEREIREFTLTIEKGEHNSACWCWACPEYEGGFDFHERIEPDCVAFNLRLASKEFDKISGLIVAGTIGSIDLCVGRVSGFYSEWSPDILTNIIKVLSGDTDHKIAIPDDVAHPIPKTGEVGNFSISTTSAVHKSTLKLEQFPLADLGEGEDYDDDESWYEEPATASETKQPELATSKKTDWSKIRLPLWIIVALLFAILVTQ